MSDRVWITDVSPRDGLQAEPYRVPVDIKADLVRAVATSGVDGVEITSFVSPKWIPQLGDAAELVEAIASDKPRDVSFSALVPNEKGLDRLLGVNSAAGAANLIDTVSVFTAASETFSQRNTNGTIAETIERFRPVVQRCKNAGLLTRGYVSCVIACPFEGEISPGAVARVCARLQAIGIDELDLGDTIGAATAATTGLMLDAVSQELGPPGTTAIARPDRTLHLHDTFGHAVECVTEALSAGIRSFDGSAGGLGGCPYASTPERRAPGNISTAALVGAIEAAGFTTNVKHDRLRQAEAVADRARSMARSIPAAEGSA